MHYPKEWKPTYVAKRLLCSLSPFIVFIHVVCPSHLPAQSSQAEFARIPANPGVQATQVEGSASISGVVLDISGAVVTGAQVSLSDLNGLQRRALTSGANGEFTFAQIAPGSYLVLISAPGLEPYKSTDIVVTAEQAYEMPRFLMAVATRRTELVIRPNEVVAAEQVKVEEQQRILGLLPNFYTSYLFDAVPLNSKQKFSLAFHDTFDPLRFIASGVLAGIEQSNNNYAGYGQGAAGYSKRFAARYGDGLTGDILSHAVLPALLHQDPRYFYQGTGTKKSRLLHAISFAVIARGDNGHPMPNYAYLFGDIGSGALSNLYYPHANRGVGLIFTNAVIGIGGRAGGTVLREFFFKRITTHVPGSGKP